MTNRRPTPDDDTLHRARLERARHDLELWGRWLMQRTSGGLGYGQGTLANLQRVARSTDNYVAPIVETQCSQVDDIVRALGAEYHQVAQMHFARGFSYAFIARTRRMAWATVDRRIAEVIRAVAYPTRALRTSADSIM
ncbi:MAG: hypothetical protein RJA99_4283 [Pseudomonadota bacterium]|jgi:hypothetical protein